MRELIDEVQCDSNGYIRLKLKGELIWCGECKYRNDAIMCPMRSEGMDTPDDWFCADGKRKDYPEVDAIYYSDGTVVIGERKDGKANGN